MSECRSCGCELVWATSAKNGKPVPLEAGGNAEKGNVRLVDGVADTLGPLEVAIAQAAGETLYLNHFATCPEREFWLGRTREDVERVS